MIIEGFSYRLPKPKSEYIDNEKLHLDRLPSDIRPVFKDCISVPHETIACDIKSQCILYPKPREYDAQKETWVPPAEDSQWRDCGDYQIGARQEVHPFALERKITYDGNALQDNKDYAWQIPIVCSPRPENGTLPVSVTFDYKTGDHVRSILEIHMDDWRMMQEFVDSYGREIGESKSERWLEDAAVRILQINYRICKSAVTYMFEQGRIVLKSETTVGILMCAADWNVFDEWKKKDPILKHDSPADLSKPSAGHEDSTNFQPDLQSVS